MAALFDNLRTGAFLTQERIRLVSWALLLGYAIALVVLAFSAHGNVDYQGRPLGTDFSNVYAAGVAVAHGDAAAPFDPAKQYSQEKAIFGAATPFYGWHYPPYFLLIAAPLAHLPYLVALIVWQITTLLLYVSALWLLLRNSAKPELASDPRWLLLALAFPAAFVNLTHGNNGFLTAALLAGGLACLERRPMVAGVLFGLLAYKPQFAIAIPLVLAASARWRTALSALLTVIALSAVVTAIFGFGIWSAFLASTHFARVVVLEQGSTGFSKIQSVFAWVRLCGGSVALAYAAQSVAVALVASALVAIWRGRAPLAHQGASLCLAALLTTPYCLDYDLVAVAPAIVLLSAYGISCGFVSYEKFALGALWFVPIIAREFAAATLIPLGTLAMLATMALVSWHALRSNADAPKAEWLRRSYPQ